MRRLGASVATLVDRFVAGELTDPWNLRSWSAKHRALPVSADMGGCFAITLTGTLVSFAWDSDSDIRVETDSRTVRIMIVQAARRYPEFAKFVPVRPDDALVCRSCGGTGRIHIDGQPVPEGIMCSCGGLGWIREGEEAP